jgi:hypothetical protein
MGPADLFKSATDSLDKITDILNVGRLLFYTAAGFLAILPAAMILRLLGHELDPGPGYWSQFLVDFLHCANHSAIWIAALVFGFVIAILANSLVLGRFTRPAPSVPEKDSYSYSYPRLFSAGVHGTASAGAKDYASWLVSEYFRYVEIAVFIPYSIVLSLPLYGLYSFIYVIRTAYQVHGVNAGHVAFALWTLGSVVAWKVIWPDFWLPKVAEPIYQDWIIARRSAIAGLKDFLNEKQPSPDKGDSQPSSNK